MQKIGASKLRAVPFYISFRLNHKFSQNPDRVHGAAGKRTGAIGAVK